MRKIHGDNFQALAGIITGASGLGLENGCLMILMKYGCHVNPRHLGRLKSGESAVGAELETEGILFSGKATILSMELSDLTTVKPFVQSFLDLKLPLQYLYLICNSNIMAPTEWLPSKQNFELQFATNNLSHFPLTELLLPSCRRRCAPERCGL